MFYYYKKKLMQSGEFLKQIKIVRERMFFTSFKNILHKVGPATLMVGWLLEFYNLATSKGISGWVLICDIAQSW